MKKVYLVDCFTEYATSLDHVINISVFKWFEDYDEAVKYLHEKGIEVKEKFADKLKEEEENGNNMALDLTEFNIDDDIDYQNYDSMWGDMEHELLAYVTLCGGF